MGAVSNLLECLDNLHMEWYRLEMKADGQENISFKYNTARVLSSLNEIIRPVSVTYIPASNIMVFICHDVINGLDELSESAQHELHLYLNEINAFHNKPGLFFYANGSINYKMTLMVIEGFSWQTITKALVSLGEVLWIDCQIISKKIMDL